MVVMLVGWLVATKDLRLAKQERTGVGESNQVLSAGWWGLRWGERADYSDRGWRYRNRAIGTLVGSFAFAVVLGVLSEAMR